MDQCLTQSLAGKLPHATHGNKHKDPQPDNMQRFMDLWALGPKQFSAFMGFLNVWIRGSLISIPSLVNFLLLLVFLIQLQCDDFPFILFYFILLKVMKNACYLLNMKKKKLTIPKMKHQLIVCNHWDNIECEQFPGMHRFNTSDFLTTRSVRFSVRGIR